MTTAAEISLREQQLDDEGHSEDCPVFSDGECAGPPLCDANTSQRAAPRRKPRQLQAVAAPGDVTLTGPAASAYRKYIAAMAELRTAKEMFAAAGQAAQVAHEEFLRLVVGAV